MFSYAACLACTVVSSAGLGMKSTKVNKYNLKVTHKSVMSLMNTYSKQWGVVAVCACTWDGGSGMWYDVCELRVTVFWIQKSGAQRGAATRQPHRAGCQTLCGSEWKRNKKAVLSQRWPRNAPYRPTGVPWKFSGIPDYAHGYYSQHFHVLLFGSTLWMFLQNLKSVALPVPEIIGGTQKNWALPG